MMSGEEDILVRLKDTALKYSLTGRSWMPDMLEAAAEEIEALRAQVAKLTPKPRRKLSDPLAKGHDEALADVERLRAKCDEARSDAGRWNVVAEVACTERDAALALLRRARPWVERAAHEDARSWEPVSVGAPGLDLLADIDAALAEKEG